MRDFIESIVEDLGRILLVCMIIIGIQFAGLVIMAMEIRRLQHDPASATPSAAATTPARSNGRWIASEK